jgi:uncharacterized protein YqgV (UPF0045/DUF77 family)
MNIRAEVSLYPLRTDELGDAISSFNRDIQNTGLPVTEGAMSTMLEGGADEVFAALCEAFKHAAEKHGVVLVLKASNACPPEGSHDMKGT